MVQVPNGAPSSAASAGRIKAQSPAVTPQTSHSTRAKNVPSVAAMANQPLSARRAEPLDLSSVERKGKQADGLNGSNQRQHINGVTEAPTFRPTEEEWREPIEYMQKIAAEGMQYGIIKIKPPDSWNPDFAVDTTVCHAHLSSHPIVLDIEAHQLTFDSALSLSYQKAGAELCRRRFVLALT